MDFGDGTKVEVQLKDGNWYRGVVRNTSHSASFPTWWLILDDGRSATCCSYACIRRAKGENE